MNWPTIQSSCCLLLMLLAHISAAMAGEVAQCDSLSELACIKSPVCTLVQVKTNDYQCRAAAGKCEPGFIQWGEKQAESCESKPGCKYVPGNCYCPPDVMCVCGGGKPPQCSATYTDEHPVFYVDKGACPFECCTYRDWGTEKTTRLYAEPKSNGPVIGTAEKGTTVKAQTGEVHTTPGKLIVTRDVTTFRKGDILWVYTYLGEGYFKIWYRGKFIEDQIDINMHNPAPDDWGYYEIMPNSLWWVKIRTPGGLEGWTNEPDNFSNRDACG